MRLLICLITFERLSYTKKTLRDLWDSIEVPYYLVIVDNNSTDGTQKYLGSLVERNRADHVIFNDENYYPGKATNIGWTEGLKEFDATHLMRLDNDMHLVKGWDTTAEDYFKKIPELGQLGLDHEAIEDPRADLRVQEINGKRLNPWPGTVGGPCIIRRKLWDLGIRYDDMKWDDGRRSKSQEDSAFSRKVTNLGYLFGHMTENLSRTFANKSNWKETFPEYYKKTHYDRGYDELLEEVGL